MVSFHERLRTLRIDNNVMAKDVASLLGIAYRNYQRYENGEADVQLSKLITLANYFNCSIDYLVGRSETKERQP